MNNSPNLVQELETMGTAALAASSKTPFKTAFKVTLGIGVAHLVLFLGGILGLALVIGIVIKVFA